MPIVVNRKRQDVQLPGKRGGAVHTRMVRCVMTYPAGMERGIAHINGENILVEREVGSTVWWPHETWQLGGSRRKHADEVFRHRQRAAAAKQVECYEA